METILLTDGAAKAEILRQIRICDYIDIAVAWAGRNDIVSAIAAADNKLRNVVIGTHMYQTDPKVLEILRDSTARVISPNTRRLFHPKIYLFTTDKIKTAIIGSHNLTRSAFGNINIEASVFISGTGRDNLFRELHHFVRSSWKAARTITDDFLYSYGIQYQLNIKKRRALRRYRPLQKPFGTSPPSSALLLTWNEYVRQVRDDPAHALEKRLAVLERASSLFDENSFSLMSYDERRAIAGTYPADENTLGGLPWGWFGSMAAFGVLKSLVRNEPKRLSDALDNIPRTGPVKLTDFTEFLREFKNSFESEKRAGSVATATRLLAMKRPDVFVCVSKANKTRLCQAWGTPPSALKLENYWDRIIEPMQETTWWQEPRPRSIEQGRIWDGRSALLDSLYYDPDAK